jgi:hypothetical protein
VAILLQRQGIQQWRAGTRQRVGIRPGSLAREASLLRRKSAQIYSIALRNSNPNNLISPAVSCLKTLAAIGGVSLGTMLEEAGEGAGIVNWTI